MRNLPIIENFTARNIPAIQYYYVTMHIILLEPVYMPIKNTSLNMITSYVTGFMKTGPNRTRTEIHFIA